MRRFGLFTVVLGGLLTSGWAAAQAGGPDAGSGTALGGAAAKTPAFDVISVKPGDPGSRGGGIRITPDGFAMSNIRLDVLLREGLQLGPNEIVGEPDWAKSLPWVISAKVAGEDVDALSKMNFDDRRRMWLQVLTERFGLKYHTEKHELPVYALVVAKGGPKLTAAKAKPDAKPATFKGGPSGGPGRMMMGFGRVTAESSTTEFLASALSRQVGRKVVDKTGLTGQYDFDLTWAPEPGEGGTDGPGKGMIGGGPGPGGDRGGGPMGAGGAASDPGSGASLFTAIQEQLGLKLEPQKAMVDVVVIDHLEKPSEN